MTVLQIIEGGITSALGFKAAGAHIGLRKRRKDLALVSCDVPCAAAAVFTTNLVKGAPILWNQEVMSVGKKVKAIVVNSANANSGTGAIGVAHAKEMAQTVAGCLGLDEHEVIVASTGVIGAYLPIEQIKNGIRSTAPLLSNESASATDAACAITTTDTFIKQAAMEISIQDKKVTIGAMAKGSGMVHPNMATTLGFVATDLAISESLLQKALKTVVSDTFNMISVDGDTSTNDMVVLLANGLAGNAEIENEDDSYALFVEALSILLTHLAKEVARDGEGATKLIEVTVSGAESKNDARTLARSVVSSSLVKTSVFAEEVNWGRIVASLGSSGVIFDFGKLCMSLANNDIEVALLVDGLPYWIDETLCQSVLASSHVKILISVGNGPGAATAWGCDLTYDYIKKNGSYKAGYKSAAMESINDGQSASHPANQEVVA